MGAEIGATTSTFGYDESMARYLRSTGRADVAAAADEVKSYLTGDDEVYANPEKYFDKVIEINLSELEPHLNGPFTPDLATPISQMKEAAAKNNWPTKVEVGLIGSCTNSSYEDISRAVSLAKQVAEKGLKTKAEFTSHQAVNWCGIPSKETDSWIPLPKSVQPYLPMPADPVSACGTGWVRKNKREIPSCILSTGTLPNVQMATPIHWHLWPALKL